MQANGIHGVLEDLARICAHKAWEAERVSPSKQEEALWSGRRDLLNATAKQLGED